MSISLFLRLQIYFLRLVSNVIVLGLLGGSGYLIYYVAQQEPDERDVDFNENLKELAKEIYERYRVSGRFQRREKANRTPLQICYLEIWVRLRKYMH